MESANLKLPEEQVLVVGSNNNSPSNLGGQSNCFEFGNTLETNLQQHHHAWSLSSSSSSSNSSSSSSPPFSSCSSSVGSSINNNNQSYEIGMLSNSSTALRHYKSCDETNNNNNIMVDLGLINNLTSWNNTYPNNLASYDKIKDEISESFPKFTELLLNSPSDTNIDDYNHFLQTTHHLKNSQNKDHHVFNDLSSASSSGQIDGQDYRDQISSIIGGRGQFCQIYPTVNISSLSCHQNYCPLMKPITNVDRLMDNNISNLGIFSSNYNFGVNDNQIQQSHDKLQCDRTTTPMILMNNSEMTDLEKRSMESIRGNNQLTASNKKSRSESKTPSCPPFKVRKEKLGDRIAALQQLVSPFGKTDTASVLMEAIGYIKFLQNQVETLSVPYMKSSRNKSTAKTMQGQLRQGFKEDGNEEGKRDLRSRGLCLVPLSCMSYVTGDHGGGSGGGATIWPPPTFIGTT